MKVSKLMVALAYDAMAHTYLTAWIETDDQLRRALLEGCWAETGLLLTPTQEVFGCDAVGQYIGSFQLCFPGSRLTIISRVIGHHDRLCFIGAIQDAHGRTLGTALNVGEIRADGVLTRMTIFPLSSEDVARIPHLRLAR